MIKNQHSIIRVIGFDYGGVIAGIPSSEFNNKVAGLLGVELEVFRDLLLWGLLILE